jgi:hypothetical protein
VVDKMIARWKQRGIDPFVKIFIVRDRDTKKAIPSTKDGETISYTIYVAKTLSSLFRDDERFVIEHRIKRKLTRKKRRVRNDTVESCECKRR